jgi:hypothetical protein
MTFQRAFGLFYACYLADLDHAQRFPERLQDAGFAEVDRRPVQDPDAGRTDRVLHHDGRSSFAFTFLADETGGISDGALVFPESAAEHAALLEFVNALPNLVETTGETRYLMAFAPEAVSWPLLETRFWTSKSPGQTGLNISLGPALTDFPGGGRAVALTIGRNPHVADRLDPATLAELTGPGSRLAKFVLIFAEFVRKTCPDYEKILWAAEAYGYRGDVAPGARSFLLNGGFGPNAQSEDITSAIHVNCDTDFDFEFALSFILDERLPDDVIRAALFSGLGMEAGPGDDGKAVLELADGHYFVSHWCTSATFGNHSFLLQR